MRRVLAILLCAACNANGTPVPAPTPPGSAPPASAAPSTAAATVAPATPTNDARATTAVRFCAYGGQGPMPAGASPDDFVRVVVVVDVTLPEGASAAGVAVEGVELSNDDGATAMRALVEVGRVEPRAEISWASAMQERGRPFDGNLAAGTTRLRIEAFLARQPRGLQQRVRVLLRRDGGAPIAAEGSVDGEWPTG